ncbi:MAG: DUF1573 domain-containing protein [Bacteroidetes bacterium]|nr:DUF1573 domain-containing protein [Bacteroidota bacterium]
MKKVLFTLAIAAFASPIFAQSKVNDVAKFKSETIELGKIEQNNPTTATFTFSNTSNQPIIIEQANPTCGCTIGDYTKAPIAPGKEGWIKATYNAAALGSFDKKMTVKFAGVDEVKSITIKGEVLSKEDYAKLKSDKLPSDKKAPAKKG